MRPAEATLAAPGGMPSKGRGLPSPGSTHHNHPMHRSRIAAFVIDCQGEDVEPAASFWSQALGRKVMPQPPGFERYRSKPRRPSRWC